MATYTTQTDFQNYAEGWTTVDPDALERLLKRAERDIDRILIATSNQTNAIWGLAITNATGGTFGLGLTWLSVPYTTQPIPYNAQGQDVLNYLGAMKDQYGNSLPLGVWQQPEVKYYSQPWAFGPLPNIPVVFEAANSMGSQDIPDFTVTNNLVGTNTAISVTDIVRGGLRINPYLLSAKEALALNRATCAQAEYRDAMGEDFFVKAQYKSIEGPKFQTTGRLPLIGPKVMIELSGTDLVQRGGRARPGYAKGRQFVYQPVGGTPIPDDWRAV